jgi:acetolactate decarboxylase
VATLNCNVPSSLMDDLTRAATGGESLSHIVTTALSQYLNKPIHTLFQVSTSGALVAGIYSGAVSSGLILQHGDFGLGTFENLDGEMVVLDGRVYRVQGNGMVSEAPADATAPFAVVTRFAPEVDLETVSRSDAHLCQRGTPAAASAERLTPSAGRSSLARKKSLLDLP